MTSIETSKPITLASVRGGDDSSLAFINLQKLPQMTCTTPKYAIKFAITEMVYNALDKDSNTITILVQQEDEFYKVTVSDNGSKKLTLDDLKKILDFKINGSSKRGLKIVSRGSIGSALKCIVGYSYALAKERGLLPQSTIIESEGFSYKITLKRNGVELKSEIIPTQRIDNGLTTFTVKFPIQENLDVKAIEEVLEGNAIINPTWLINCNLLGQKLSYGYAGSNKEPTDKTSVLWYKESEFITLFREYANDYPDHPLKEFIALFSGFRDNTTNTLLFLQKIPKIPESRLFTGNSSKISSVPLEDVMREDEIKALYTAMKAESKPIKDKRTLTSTILRPVGEEAFQELCDKNNWKLIEYNSRVSDDPKCPQMVELANIARSKDNQGRKLYLCLNHMVANKQIFDIITAKQGWSIEEWLSDLGIDNEDKPMTLIVHLITPIYQYLAGSKNVLADDEEDFS